MGKIIFNKRKLLLFFLMICSIVNCQKLRVIYSYSFSLDSLKKNEVKNEIMYLDIDNDKSIFYSYPTFVKDSIMRMQYTNGGRIDVNTDNLKKIFNNSNVKFFVEKNRSHNSSLLFLNIGMDNFAVKSYNYLNWSISEEFRNIENYRVQKATCLAFGRKWIAWFDPELPISDGPYKFEGLPGLILELQDDKNEHIFKLLAIQKNKASNQFFKKSVEISEIEFKKLWHEFKKDPAKSYRLQSFSSSNGSVKMMLDGKAYNNEEMIRQIEKVERQKLLKENNYLDLELYH